MISGRFVRFRLGGRQARFRLRSAKAQSIRGSMPSPCAALTGNILSKPSSANSEISPGPIVVRLIDRQKDRLSARSESRRGFAVQRNDPS